MHNMPEGQQWHSVSAHHSQAGRLGWRSPRNVRQRQQGKGVRAEKQLTLHRARAQQVGYCQGLNYLAGMLLLVMQRDEERSFWVLVSLLDEGAECWTVAPAAGGHFSMRLSS